MLKSVPQQDLMREVLDWSDPNADSDCEQPTCFFFFFTARGIFRNFGSKWFLAS